MFIRIYALAVCFATIIIIAISAGIALYDVVQISAPRFTLDSWQYQNLSSNDAFQRSGMMMNPGIGMAQKLAEPQEAEDLSEEEVTRRREAQLATAIEWHQRSAFQSLIQSVIFLVISSVLFYFHWRLSKQLDGSASDES